jgi:hypothetical protein
MALVSSNQSYFTQAIHRPVIALPSPHLLLKGKPRQPDTLPMIKVPKTINIISPRVNETLIGVKTNKFRDVTCAKYKSVTPRLSIDCVRAAPEQVKVVLPKEKKKRAPPSVLENEEKRQWPTIMMMHDNIKTLIDYTHALQFRLDKEHIYHKNLEYELTILSHYVFNKEKYES